MRSPAEIPCMSSTPGFDARGHVVAYKKNGALSFRVSQTSAQSGNTAQREISTSQNLSMSKAPGPGLIVDSMEIQHRKSSLSFQSGSGVGRRRSATVCLGDVSICDDQSQCDVLWTITYDDEEPIPPITGSDAETLVMLEPTPTLTEEQHLVKQKIFAGEYSMASVKEMEHTPEDQRTTVMMRNVPNRYNRESLLRLLYEYNYIDCVDFVYIPIDFVSSCNLGYCFINFTNPVDARQFKLMFEGFNKWIYNSDKKCDVKWSSHQGLASMIQRYRSSPVMHNTVPDEYKPMLIWGGEPVPFPHPKKTVKVPRMHKRRRQEKKGVTTAIEV